MLAYDFNTTAYTRDPLDHFSLLKDIYNSSQWVKILIQLNSIRSFRNSIFATFVLATAHFVEFQDESEMKELNVRPVIKIRSELLSCLHLVGIL